MPINLKIIKNIRINRFLVWQAGVVVFLLAAVIIFAININSFFSLEDELSRDIDAVGFVPKQLKEELLKKAVLQMKSREEIFDSTVSENFQVKDPSI